jgi:hypothetical protein
VRRCLPSALVTQMRALPSAPVPQATARSRRASVRFLRAMETKLNAGIPTPGLVLRGMVII